MNWLEKLKKDDEVIVSLSIPFAVSQYVDIVDRVTKTQIILRRGGKYYRKTGYQITSNKYNKTELIETTPERIAEIYQTKLRHRLKNIDWRHIALSKLERICAILDEHQ